jgi:hypothetical protein
VVDIFRAALSFAASAPGQVVSRWPITGTMYAFEFSYKIKSAAFRGIAEFKRTLYFRNLIVEFISILFELLGLL